MNCPKRGVRYRDGHGARCRGVRVPELTGSTPAAQGAKPGISKTGKKYGNPYFRWYQDILFAGRCTMPR